MYRQRRDDPKRWEYFGVLEPEYERGLDWLVTANAVELEEIIPYGETQELFGGGKYQFRFFWRDEEGRTDQKRSRNGAIGGNPLNRE